MQGLVMLLCVDSIDDDIIANVLDTGNVTDSSSNYTLKFFSCSIYAKTKALVHLYRPRCRGEVVICLESGCRTS